MRSKCAYQFQEVHKREDEAIDRVWWIFELKKKFFKFEKFNLLDKFEN